MKKSILIIGTALTTFSLTAYGIVNWENQEKTESKEAKNISKPFKLEDLNSVHLQKTIDLVYKVDTRFNATISKEKLHNAKSLVDIYPENATQPNETYKNSEISVHHSPDKSTIIKGENEVLSPNQIELLQSTDYSTNISIASVAKSENPETNKMEEKCLVYYLTVTPEKEAEYTSGEAELINYLKENSKEETKDIKEEGLKPGRVNFTVSKKGKIENVQLTSTSGYPVVDKELIKLVQNIPGKWNPAQNSKGENVDQELVFFFGLEGC